MIDRRGLLLTVVPAVGMVGLFGAWLLRPLFGGWSYRSGAAQSDATLMSEREQQASLPHAEDPLWAMLHRCKVSYDKDSGDYSLVPTPEVTALIGKTIRVKGFVVPLDGSDQPKHFLLGVNTPVCFYHPPGEPNEVIEVFADSPVHWSEAPTTVEGRFAQSTSGNLGVFFRLDNARPV